MPPSLPPPRWHFLLALTSIYLIWGSTYLVISRVVHDIPPLLSGGIRFAVAGSLLLLALRILGEPWPDRRQWGAAALQGLLLFLGGNGIVCLTSQAIPSGVIALVLSITTLFAVLLGARAGGPRPDWRVLVGIVLGTGGVAALLGHRGPGGEPISAWGIIALLAASLSWALGSALVARQPVCPSRWTHTGAQMLTGGASMLVVGLALGERIEGPIPLPAWLAMAYLITLGSWAGFGSYMWLLRHASPAMATSYAYVNPLVALVLGAIFAGEPLGLAVAVAAALIVAAVALIATAPKPALKPVTEAEPGGTR